MKKGAIFKWMKECDTAFKMLKEKLMEESKVFFGAKTAVYIQTLSLSKNCNVILLCQQCL